MSALRTIFGGLFFGLMILFICFGFAQLRDGMGEGEVAAILYGPILVATFGIAAISGGIASLIFWWAKNLPYRFFQIFFAIPLVLIATLSIHERVQSKQDAAERQRLNAENERLYQVARDAVNPIAETYLARLQQPGFEPKDAPQLSSEFMAKAQATSTERWQSIWITNYTERYFDLYSLIIPAQNQPLNLQELSLPYYGSEVCDDFRRDFSKQFATHQQALFDVVCD